MERLADKNIRYGEITLFPDHQQALFKKWRGLRCDAFYQLVDLALASDSITSSTQRFDFFKHVLKRHCSHLFSDLK